MTGGVAGNELLAWKKEAEAQPPVRRVTCPICDWTLEEHPGTGLLHCPFGDWTEE